MGQYYENLKRKDRSISPNKHKKYHSSSKDKYGSNKYYKQNEGKKSDKLQQDRRGHSNRHSSKYHDQRESKNSSKDKKHGSITDRYRTISECDTIVKVDVPWSLDFQNQQQDTLKAEERSINLSMKQANHEQLLQDQQITLAQGIDDIQQNSSQNQQPDIYQAENQNIQKEVWAPWDDLDLLKSIKRQSVQQFFKNEDSDDNIGEKSENVDKNDHETTYNIFTLQEKDDLNISVPQNVQAMKIKNQFQESKNQVQAQTQESQEDVDPLDAYMKQQVMPEVQKKMDEEKMQKIQQKMQDSQGQEKKILQRVLNDISDDEDKPDFEMQIPAGKVKLLLGPGGVKVKEIQKKSKCRIQVKKDDDELSQAFGQSDLVQELLNQKDPESYSRQKTIQIFGNQNQVDQARFFILEAIENKEQKQKNRQRETDRKKEEKQRNKHIFLLRHAKDYETLQLQPGASRYDVRKQYRQLALKWHPDKHPENKQQAQEKFQNIQRAFNNLTRVAEDEFIEQIL